MHNIRATRNGRPPTFATRDRGGRAFLRAALRYAKEVGRTRTPEGPSPDGPEPAMKRSCIPGL